MKIREINGYNIVNGINRFRNNVPKTNSIINRISFKGTDEFIKETDLSCPPKNEVLHLSFENMQAKEFQFYDVATKVNGDIIGNKINPLIDGGKYKFAETEFERLLKRNGALMQLKAFVDEIYGRVVDSSSNMPYFIDPRKGNINAITVVSKDKQMAQDILDFLPFYSKMSALYDAYTDKTGVKFWKNCYDLGLKNRYITLKDKDIPNKELQKKIYHILNESEEHYKRTGGYTYLKVNEIERLLSEETNSPGDVAEMKDITQCSKKDYHLIFLCPIQEPDKLERGIYTAGRLQGAAFDLDESGITKQDVYRLKIIQENAEPLANEAEQIFKGEEEVLIALRRKLDGIIEEDSKNWGTIYALYKDPEKNREEIIAFVDKLKKETEEVKNESFETAWNKLMGTDKNIVIPEETISNKEVIQNTTDATKDAVTNATPKEAVQKAEETIKEQTIEIETQVKNSSSFLSKLKSMTLKFKKSPFPWILGLAVAGIGLYAYIKKKSTHKINKSLINQNKSNLKSTMLKSISFNDFFNKKQAC